MWHGTKRENLPSIAVNGLVPHQPGLWHGGGVESALPLQCGIYLTPDRSLAELVVYRYFGFTRQTLGAFLHEWAILRVDVSDLKLWWSDEGKDYRHLDTITPDRITFKNRPLGVPSRLRREMS